MSLDVYLVSQSEDEVECPTCGNKYSEAVELYTDNITELAL